MRSSEEEHIETSMLLIQPILITKQNHQGKISTHFVEMFRVSLFIDSSLMLQNIPWQITAALEVKQLKGQHIKLTHRACNKYKGYIMNV